MTEKRQAVFEAVKRTARQLASEVELCVPIITFIGNSDELLTVEECFVRDEQGKANLVERLKSHVRDNPYGAYALVAEAYSRTASMSLSEKEEILVVLFQSRFWGGVENRLAAAKISVKDGKRCIGEFVEIKGDNFMSRFMV